MNSRRKFIRNTMMSLPAWSLTGLLLSSCEKSVSHLPGAGQAKTGIIGAGLAGLEAARLLIESGYQAEILEASDRIGGRILSEELLFGAFPAEMGTSYAWESDPTWLSIMQKQASEVMGTETPSTFFLDGSPYINKDLMLMQDYAYMMNAMQEMSSYTGPQDKTVSAYMNEKNVPERVKFIFGDYASEAAGTSPDRAPVFPNMKQGLCRTVHNRIINRSGTLKSLLTQRYRQVLPNVLNNTPAMTIDYNGEKVIVTDARQNSHVYDKLIVTVPLSILKLEAGEANAIRFHPSLPEEKIQAMNHMSMDSCMRIHLRLNKRFWDMGSLRFFVPGKASRFDVIHEDLVSNRFIVSCTVFGATAEEMDNLSETGIMETIRSDWQKHIGSQAAASITGIHVKSWGKDSFIRGGFSYHTQGGNPDARAILAAPVSDKIFFAGEACQPGLLGGTAGGAVESAVSAASSVMSIL